MTLTDTDRAYCAAIIDGEGCVAITRSSRGNAPRLVVAVVNTSEALIRWMQERFGGRINEVRRKRRTRGERPTWDWRLHNQAAADFLDQVRPYLVIKGDQADLAIQYASAHCGRRPGQRMTAAEADDRARYAEAMWALNGSRHRVNLLR